MNEMHMASLHASYAQSPSPDVMEQLVEGYLPLSRAIARKFTGRGVEQDDLEQVAAIALMKAIERFEPDRGLKFTTYATPTIAGEVRNYLRDKGSLLRVSRDARSRLYQMQQVRDKLTQQLMREPTVKELAAGMGIDPEELLSLLDQREATDVMSLSAASSTDEDAQLLEEKLGTVERGYEQVEQSEWMQWIMRQLSDTEKQLLQLRFIEKLGQRDTAKMMNVSQMQVSRLERRMLARLREMTERWHETM